MNKHATTQTMTRFEYTAIKAMQAMISNGQYEEQCYETIADLAIGFAEKMEEKLDEYIFWEDK